MKTNYITTKTKLNFNVNLFKTWIKKYYESHDDNIIVVFNKKKKSIDKKETQTDQQTDCQNEILIDNQIDDKITDDKITDDHINNEHKKYTSFPKIAKSSYISLTAILEVLCDFIIRKLKLYTKIDYKGLYTIDKNSVFHAISLDKEFGDYFFNIQKKYEDKITYCELLCIPKNDIINYIETRYSSVVKFNNTGYNELAFLFVQFFSDIMRISKLSLNYADKKTLEYSNILCSVNILLGDNELTNNINIKVNEVVSNIYDDKNINTENTEIIENTENTENILND